MDHDELRAALRGGETFTVEFKRDPLNDAELVEAVVCLANGDGGTLIIGVDDDGRVLGAKHRHGTSTHPNRLDALIANRTQPPVTARSSVEEIDEQQVIVVTVPAADTVVATTDGKYLRRAINVNGRPECLPMAPNDVLSRAGAIGAKDYSGIAIPELAVEDLAVAELEQFRDMVRAGGDHSLLRLSDVELLRALNLLTPSGDITLGAILLFGSPTMIHHYVPTHEVRFRVLEGSEVRVNEGGYTPLFRAMQQLVDRVKVRNQEEEIDLGILRVSLPQYADVTTRELIANALVHRDYAAMGATQVEITPEALRVSNPGGFPSGVRLSNLLTTPPLPRNPLLAEAFTRAGLVERTGRGINRAFESQLSLGRPAPDYSQTVPNTVIVRVHSGAADKGLAAFIAEAHQSGHRFDYQHLLALHEIRQERRITSDRAAELFQVGVADARNVLNRLVELGWVESRGERKGRTYHLSAAVYDRLGESIQYLRTRGFDDIQQEQMVFSYLERFDSISRHQAAELCHISPDQASRLLRSLRDEGRLVLVGSKRGARYVLPDVEPRVRSGGI